MMFNKSFLIFSLILLTFNGNAYAKTDVSDPALKGKLNIIIKGIRSERTGELIIKLYQGEKNWLELGKELSQQAFPIAGRQEIRTLFIGLPYGEDIAVQVLHDENDNREVDFQWFPPKPKEGIGVSNNQFRLGPPSYSDAKVHIQEMHTLTINMHY